MRVWTLLFKNAGEWHPAKTCVPTNTEHWEPEDDYSPILFFSRDAIEDTWGDVVKHRKGHYAIYCINFKKEELK